MTPRRLREMVAVMRELHVQAADGIVLAPLPAPTRPPLSESERREREKQAAEDAERTLFAASGVMPR